MFSSQRWTVFGQKIWRREIYGFASHEAEHDAGVDARAELLEVASKARKAGDVSMHGLCRHINSLTSQ